ncbi:MAG: tetratricopeptide repeat protein, partial [Acidobacteriota bacterium]
VAGLLIVRQAELARQQAAQAQATADFLERTLIDANIDSDSAGDDSLSALLERAEPRIDAELKPYPQVRARVRLLLALAFDSLGRLEDSRRLHRLALDEAEEHFGAQSSQFGWALVGVANTDTAPGSEERLELLGRARAIFERNHGPRSRQVMETLNLIGHARTHAGDLEAGLEAYRQALGIATEVLGAEDPWFATTLANVGSAERRLGRLEASIQSLRRAVDHYVDAEKEETRTALSIRNNLAVALGDAGRLDEAEAEYRRLVELQRKKLGADHPGQAATLTNLGRLLMERGRFEAAEKPIRRAAELLGKSEPETDFTRLAAEINLGTLRLELGDVDSARRIYASARGTFLAQLGDSHAATLRISWLLGEAERRRGSVGEARRWLEMEAEGAQVSERHLADRLLSRGRLALDEGRPGRALELLEEALNVYRRHFEETDLRLLETLAEKNLAERGAEGEAEESRGRLEALYRQLERKVPAGNWRLERLRPHLANPVTRAES